MNNDKFLEKIIIIDYGSQFTQLIARKVRENGVYSEIINFNQINNLKKDKSIKGIILSGGPLTITNKSSTTLHNYILNLNNLGNPLPSSSDVSQKDESSIIFTASI